MAYKTVASRGRPLWDVWGKAMLRDALLAKRKQLHPSGCMYFLHIRVHNMVQSFVLAGKESDLSLKFKPL